MRSVLVANRGEIARRVFRSAKRRGMRAIAVYSDADADAPFVREADTAVRLPGTAPGDTYLRGDLIIAAALRTGAESIHPGYGFLSENAEFARDVIAACLTWIGPPVEAIAAMGSKPAAKALMAAAGVPTAPSAEVSGLEGDALLAAADGIGFPLLVKASFGGGGRGMRSVTERAALLDAVASARREAASAFGNGDVFLEKLITPARHIEVQIFGDTQGNVVALHERECSLQRRHQKVVEETPSPAVNDALRARLADAAVKAGKALAYTGAGTVEFLLGPGGEFFFLEVNTRLQVEHPVTEAVTGLDLVELQFAVAEGQPLPSVAYEPPLHGAAIEVRLYAEDPARDWLPQAGLLDAFTVGHDGAFGGVGLLPSGAAVRGVRLDSGVETASTIGVSYDPMLAKVISWAPSRTEASALLAAALRRARIDGVVTNRDLLVRVLDSPEWLAGDTDTGFFDRIGLEELAKPLVDVVAEPDYALAAALGQAALRRRDAPVLANLPSGWRSNPSQPQYMAYTAAGREEPIEVAYTLGRGGLVASVNGEALECALIAADPGADRVTVVLEAALVRRSFDLHVVSAQTPLAAGPVARVHVNGPDGSITLNEVPRFPEPSARVEPGSLTASMPGSVVRVLVSDGDTVAAGQPVVVLEAMKMEHTITAPAAGTVTTVAVAVGAQVETGSLLVVVGSAAQPE